MAENIRTTEATWSDTKEQWRVRVRRDGVPHDFYSTIPGKKGKLDAESPHIGAGY